MLHNNSIEAGEHARRVIPGGVNSPVRAFKSVGGNPVFFSKGKGSCLTDIDGNGYIDYVCAWGPLILGHAFPQVVEAVQKTVMDGTAFGAPTERETELAELIISMVPSIGMVRLVNSGTEATMSAVRLARGYTRRDLIVKFQGCYHGHGDSFLIAAGSGALTFGIPESAGVTRAVASTTLVAQYNDVESVENLFKQYGEQIAAVIVEPVAGNMGVILPEKTFLPCLREITKKYGALLIFDEVMTGFRLSAGGAQSLFGISPEISSSERKQAGSSSHKLPCTASERTLKFPLQISLYPQREHFPFNSDLRLRNCARSGSFLSVHISPNDLFLILPSS